MQFSGLPKPPSAGTWISNQISQEIMDKITCPWIIILTCEGLVSWYWALYVHITWLFSSIAEECVYELFETITGNVFCIIMHYAI